MEPLAKEERENLAAIAEDKPSWVMPAGGALECMRRLLEAEAFWRETVKTLPGFIDESDGRHVRECMFCSATENDQHLPNCSWKLAQEE